MKIKCNDMWMNYCLLHVIHLSGSVWIDFCTTPQELQSIRLRHHVKLFSATMVTSGGVVAIKRRPFRILGWNLHTIYAVFSSRKVGWAFCTVWVCHKKWWWSSWVWLRMWLKRSNFLVILTEGKQRRASQSIFWLILASLWPKVHRTDWWLLSGGTIQELIFLKVEGHDESWGIWFDFLWISRVVGLCWGKAANVAASSLCVSCHLYCDASSFPSGIRRMLYKRFEQLQGSIEMNRNFRDWEVVQSPFKRNYRPVQSRNFIMVFLYAHEGHKHWAHGGSCSIRT